MEKLDKILKIAEDLNKKNNIVVPIFNDLKIEKNSEKNCIFIAKDNKGLLEQLFIDEPLQVNETLDERIKKTQEETYNFLKQKQIKTNVQFYKNYYNSFFEYKIYEQDIITNNTIIKQLDTYFIEPTSKNVYKLTLAYGPVKISCDNSDLSENICDAILDKLNALLAEVLDNIKYND